MDKEKIKRDLFNYFCEHSVELINDCYVTEVAECLDVDLESLEDEESFEELYDEVFNDFMDKLTGLKL